MTTKTKPKIKRIHVNQHVIRQNLKSGEYAPVITVKQSKSNAYGHEVHILDNDGNVVAKVVQPQNARLSCGARVWIETQQKVVVIDYNGGVATIVN